MSVRIKSYNLSGITICNTLIYTIRCKGTNFLSFCKIFRKVFCHKTAEMGENLCFCSKESRNQEKSIKQIFLYS